MLKNFNLLFYSISCCFVCCLMFPYSSEASTYNDVQTGRGVGGITFTETSSTTESDVKDQVEPQKGNNSSNGNNVTNGNSKLPQTGEYSNIIYVIFGCIVLMVLILFFFTKDKNNIKKNNIKESNKHEKN